MQFMRESDSPIKMGLSDIPHVAESEKTSFFFNKAHKMERAGGGVGAWVDCGWGFPSKMRANMRKTVKARVWGSSILCLLRPRSLEDSD